VLHEGEVVRGHGVALLERRPLLGVDLGLDLLAEVARRPVAHRAGARIEAPRGARLLEVRGDRGVESVEIHLSIVELLEAEDAAAVATAAEPSARGRV